MDPISIIGAVFIVLGLYTVVWGKIKDRRNEDTNKFGDQELPVTSNYEKTNDANNNNITPATT